MIQKPEIIFNLYFYATLDLITEVGVVPHTIDGSDADKMKFLKENVENDFKNAIKFELPQNFKIKIHDEIRNAIDYASYRNMCSIGHGMLIFENIFNHFYASANPFAMVTPIKDGKIFIEGEEAIKAPDTPPPKYIHIEKQKEWYVDYIDSSGFHFDKLINDDFIEAVRILFNAKHYVSSMKLLMICVDTMSYLEFGDVRRNFQLWLDAYADLAILGFTPDELWEFRNSILHMTNLDSRKVQSNEVKRLMFYVAATGTEYAKETEEGKYFKFKDLLEQLSIGISKWANSYNIEKEKFEVFLARYDRIISDKRKTSIYYTNKFGKD